MLTMNPIVLLPLPAALAVLAFLAFAALQYTDRWPSYPSTPAERPRHRLASTPEPYRPRSWSAPTAETPTVPVIPGPERFIDPLDARMPLEEVERLAAKLEEMRQRNDNRMWSWSDEADTRELATA